MSENQSNIDKLSQVLELFLSKDYNIVSTTYLDLLVTQISEKINDDKSEVLELITNWILKALSVWNNFQPCQAVGTFTIKLVAIVSKDESVFLKYHKKYDVYNKLCQLFEFEKSPSKTVAFLTLFLNLLEHGSGRQWMIEAEIWRVILKTIQENPTMYIMRDSQIYMGKLLMKESDKENLCKKIIETIVEPIINVSVENEIDNHAFKTVVLDRNKLLINTVDFINAILEKSMFEDLQNPIPDMFENTPNFETSIKAFFVTCLTTPYMKSLQKLSMLLIFVKIRAAIKTSSSVEKSVFDKFTFNLCYNAMVYLQGKHILLMFCDCKLALTYFRKLQNLKKFDIPKPQKYENQAITLMILPLCTATKPYYIKDHYFFEEFMDKIFNVTSTTVQRVAYNIRNVILQSPELPMESICAKSIEHMLEIVDLMERDTVIIMFQTMCHVLKNFVPNDKALLHCKKQIKNTDESFIMQRREPFLKPLLGGDPITEKPILLAALLNGLITITEKFHLKWQECVETICILTITQDILGCVGVDPKICILILKLCKLAVENFMQPNLALLVDLGPHSKEIGPMLYSRLHDVNWEIKDSALEVLNSMAIVSEHKYIFYQKFIIENKFLDVTFDMVQSNNEYYQRASALTLLATSVRINLLWEKVLSKMNLQDVAFKLILNESEAIVRREAVKLIIEMFIHRNWQAPVIKDMVYTMTAASILDLHWEVKINALEFWSRFVNYHLASQGMVNGTFPDVTFSKKRRVIELTETEISNRLHNTLDELAEQGCLGILINALNDESDFEVARTAASIILDLKKTLLKYKITEPNINKSNNLLIESMETDNTENSSNVNTSNAQEESLKVIEDIIASNDINILATMCTEAVTEQKIVKKNFDYLKKVKKDDFLKIIYNFDFDEYLNTRKSWLNTHTCSLDSILDDILTVHNNEINCMDCY